MAGAKPQKTNGHDPEFKIEKGVTFSPRGKYPFLAMEIGDSFFVPANLYRRVISAASHMGSRKELKFSFRKTNDGYRCWRVE